MKKILFIILSIICYSSRSQNLVPNPGFEYHTPSYMCNCCSNASFYNCFDDWSSPNWTTPDFFGTCCQFASLNIPANFNGYQATHSGIHYCGIVVYHQPASIPWPYSYREYIQTLLFEPLDSNKTYFIKFYVSLADTANRASSNIDIYFSDTLIHFHLPPPAVHILNFNPQVKNPDSNIITNKVEWIEINGIYLASGGERYMVIGNFLEDSISNLITVSSGTINAYFAYYYIDDVMIRQVDTVHYPAIAGNDTLICFGDSARLGLYNFSDYTYQWSSSTSINNDSIGIPWVKPDTTTTYYLTQTDNYGLQSTDTITIYVDCYPAGAGMDDTICNEDTIVVGTHNFSSYQYNWQSFVTNIQVFGFISDSTVGTPMVWPDTTASFYCRVIDSIGNISYDSVLITVVDCDTLGITENLPGILDFTIYPNPAKEEVVIEFKYAITKAANFKLQEITGRIILDEMIPQGIKKYVINTTEIPNGVYLITIRKRDITIITKTIILK